MARVDVTRDRAVRSTLVIEGAANLVALATKLVVAATTGSIAVLADALHSVTDVANNVVAYVVMHFATKPPDRSHPYGHRKFETLAVFALATLLTVTAIEIVLHALRSGAREIAQSTPGLIAMICLLVLQVVVAFWERGRARTLASDILHADAQHTLSDVLVTILVIIGWQVSALGHAWIDTLLTVVVAVVVGFFAFDLFRRVVPVLVDESAHDPDSIRTAAREIDGVQDARTVRSRWVGSKSAIDIVVTVSPAMTTAEAHQIADAVEDVLTERFATAFVNVHVEPADP